MLQQGDRRRAQEIKSLKNNLLQKEKENHHLVLDNKKIGNSLKQIRKEKELYRDVAGSLESKDFSIQELKKELNSKKEEVVRLRK